MSDLLTVVVPIYNVEMYLNRCILSIVSQTYKNIEIILVDDGSIDNSGNICDEWAGKDTRIRVIHKENGGLSDARNAGINVAKGKYIAFVDGDDSIACDTYEVMLSNMEITGAKIACCGKRKLYVNGTDELTQNCEVKMVFNKIEAIGKLLEGKEIDESACDKVFDIALFKDIRFPKGEINEDLPVMPLLFAQSDTVVHVGKAFYNYYQNTGSITRSGYSSKMHVYIEHLQKIKEYIIREFPDLEKELSILLARYSCSMLYRLCDNRVQKKIFYSDYLWYKNEFKKCYHIYINSVGLSTKDIILARCMYYGMGGFISWINNTRKSLMRIALRIKYRIGVSRKQK